MRCDGGRFGLSLPANMTMELAVFEAYGIGNGLAGKQTRGSGTSRSDHQSCYGINPITISQIDAIGLKFTKRMGGEQTHKKRRC